MEFIIQFIVALFATLSFAVIFSAPKKELFYCGFVSIAYRDTVPYDNGAHFCCGTLYACDSLSAFRYLSSCARSRNFLHGILSFYE